MSLFRWIIVATLAGAVSDEPAKVPASNGYVAVAVLPSADVSDEGTLDEEPRVEIGEAVVRIYDAQGRVIAVQ